MPSTEVTENDGRIQYTASASQTVFAYDFLIFDEADITVIKDGVTLTLGAGNDYTVSGVGNASGGNITLTTGASAGELVTIFRDTVIQRESQYQVDCRFDAEPIERDLDRITVILQELDRDLSRSIVLNPEDASSGITLPSLQADRILKVNSAADNFELAALSEITSFVPDTNISGESSGDILEYDGTNWVNTKSLTANLTFSGVPRVTNVNAAGSGGGVLRTAGGTNCLSWGGGGSANLTAGGNLSMGTTHKIVNCADPSSAQDVATKAYVDSNAASPTIVQSLYEDRTTTFSTATAIPYDDTIPQNTEGAEVMTLTIKPENATNKLRIRVSTTSSNSSAGYLILALFKDSDASALAAEAVWSNASDAPTQLNLVHEMEAGTESDIIFKVRAGSASGTMRMNGIGAGRRLGGVAKPTITIEEIAT